MTTTTTTRPDAATHLQALQDELAGLAMATRDARRTGDVVEWIRLLNRGEELPGEIATAEALAAAERTPILC